MNLIQTLVGKSNTSLRGIFVALIGLATLLVSVSASALPKVGDGRASIKLFDGWDRAFDLAKVERPLLLIYEDKDSQNQNQALKDALVELEQGQHYRKYVAHLVVADVSAYDYWPAKGIAKGELQKWSQRLGIVIYGDFSGQAKKGLDIDAGRSNVLLYSKEGKVLFAHSGALNASQRNDLLDRIRTFTRAAAPPAQSWALGRDLLWSGGAWTSSPALPKEGAPSRTLAWSISPPAVLPSSLLALGESR